MSSQSANLPLLGAIAGFRRCSVDEYHRLAEIGILTEADNLELIEGYLVHKMTRNPRHVGTMHHMLEVVLTLLPPLWKIRIQSAITLAESEPEPDLAIVRQDARGNRDRHPQAADVTLVIEVSDSTLAGDRQDKTRIYGRAGIATYWIVNIPDMQIEVYSHPSGPTALPGYARRGDYRAADMVPLVVDGVVVASPAAQDLLG